MTKPFKRNDPIDSPLAPQRRRLLAGSAGALAAVGLAGVGRSAQASTPPAVPPAAPAAPRPLPAYVGVKDASALIVHSSSTIETKRSAFGAGLVTPVPQLYVRNNLPAPAASILEQREDWSVVIEGVKQARAMTLRELKSLGVETLPMVLQCSGNGRGFFPSKPAGTPWLVGAAGCVVWTGVPLRTVVEELGGVVGGMRFITGTGGEQLPPGIDPLSVMVERSVPLKALGDALLAWELNGEPIPLAHGGPLRLVFPGYTGVNQIKYVKRVAFTSEETQAKIMSHGYRISPPGEKADPSQPSVLEMGIKSWINTPLPEHGELRVGRHVVQGVAFGGTEGVRRVEVSIDGGKTWREARFVGPELGKFAWRQFALNVTLPAGQHRLVSRAVDNAGRVQPEQRFENVSGYNNNSWADHGVTVTVVA